MIRVELIQNMTVNEVVLRGHPCLYLNPRRMRIIQNFLRRPKQRERRPFDKISKITVTRYSRQNRRKLGHPGMYGQFIVKVCGQNWY